MAKGSAPFHYVLDELGGLVVAADQGAQRRHRWRQDRALILSRSQRLAHTVGLNGFFAALLGEARRRPGCRLVERWSERRCQDWCGDLVRPDGYGAWQQDRTLVEFLVEFDRGTEPLDTLAKKLDGYGQLADALQRHIPVVFVFPSARREATARSALAGAGVPVVTGVAGTCPTDAVWLPLAEVRRQPLRQLGGLRGGSFRTFERGNWPAWMYQSKAPRGG